jgi:hypothetical protein
MDQYTSDVFTSLVGQVLCFHRTANADDPAIHLELLEVESSRQHATADARQPFSLLFALRSGDPTEQSMLHLRHSDFEPCAWFVNRVSIPGRDPRTPYYEAVFG